MLLVKDQEGPTNEERFFDIMVTKGYYSPPKRRWGQNTVVGMRCSSVYSEVKAVAVICIAQ